MWSRLPLLRLIIPFICGIILSVRLNLIVTDSIFYIFAFLILVLGFFFGALFSFRNRWIYGLIIISFFILCGLSFTRSEMNQAEERKASISDDPLIYLVELNEPFELRERSCRTSIRILAVKDSLGWSKCEGSVMLYTEKDSTLLSITPGGTLILYTALQEVRAAKNPGEFDYKTYLSHQGIHHTAYLKKGEWRLCKKEGSFNILQYATRLRSQLLEKLSKNGISGADFGLSAALLLGDDSHLDADVRDVYSRAGAMHVLCVSGLHVGVVFLVLSTLLGFLNRFRAGRMLLPILLILCIWFYALITGLASPVLRASCMLSFIIIGKGLRRQTNVYNTLAAAALLMLMLDPFILFSAGFQLSFAAVIGIVSLQQPLYKLFYFRYKIFNSLWAITTVSIAAQLGTLPIVLYYFHQFPVYGLLTNFIVIPMASFIIYCGAAIFIIPFGKVSILVAYVLQFLILVMDSGVSFIESLPHAIISAVNLDEGMVYLCFLIIIGLSGFLISKRKGLLFLGLISLLFLSGYRMHKLFVEQHQRAMLVYALNRYTAVDVINGKKHVFIADSSLLADEKTMGYSIKPNWLKKGLDEPQVLVLQGMSSKNDPGMLQILPSKEFRWAIWTGALPERPMIEKLKLDYLILRGRCSFEASHLLSYFEPGMLIIDGSVPPWDSKKLKENSVDIKIWDVREKGAFVLDY